MRVTRIPGDFHDISERACRVWCNEVEVADWTVADDFRRVVETPEGARFGSVRIAFEADQAVDVPAIPMTALSGIFVPEPKPEMPAIEIVEAAPPLPTHVAAPKAAGKPKKKRNR